MTDYIKYYRVACDECGNESYGTQEEYDREMDNPFAQWQCKVCGTRGAFFDDDYYEENTIDESEQNLP